MKNKPFVLIILDGWGVAPPSKGNAIALANTPNIDGFLKKYSNTTLNATGSAVGLEANQMGGSEAGHLNIGAGRIVKQDSQYISEAIESGKFFKNLALRKAINHTKVNNSSLHLIGLLSSKDSPHSNPKHLSALLLLAKLQKVKKVYLHLFTDGRDTLPRSSLKFLDKLEKKLENFGLGKIATIGGRFYGMDRTKNWPRLLKAYQAMVDGKGEKSFSAKEAIEQAYAKGLSDEFILPAIICDKNKKPTAKIQNNDAIIFFNLRSDRARQLSKLFVLDKIKEIENDDTDSCSRDARKRTKLKNLFFVAMTDFGPALSCHTAFKSHDIEKTLPAILKKFKQLYIAETEKYAHITYFFNGGHANPVGNEKRIMIPSPKVASYTQKPEMSAYEITQVVKKNIQKDVYDFYAINFANTDMVGHTGNLGAAIKAVEIIDQCVGEIAKEILKKKGTCVITADHGNSDEMIDLKTGDVLTMHSKNPVPFIIVSQKPKAKPARIASPAKNAVSAADWQSDAGGSQKLRLDGTLSDIAPTILEIMKIKKPVEMTGKSLIIQNLKQKK
jgi:2,3-bisphosphoglycerate-independent phosphoglycerate mutase